MKNNNDEFLRKRRERQIKIRKRRLKIIFVFFLVILLITGVILSLTVLFPIKNITASGSLVYKPAQIINSCGVEIGDNLFRLNQEKILNTLRKKLPFVESVELKRKLPDKIELKITDAKEYACYQYKGKYYTVSQDGWVLEKYDERPENVLLILCENVVCKKGSQVEMGEGANHAMAQELIDLLNENKIMANYVDITVLSSLKAKVENRFVVNFGTATDLEYKMRHLKSMLKEIPQNDTGNINLSMWNSQNTQGTFVQSDIK